jgi:hypothetical protein
VADSAAIARDQTGSPSIHRSRRDAEEIERAVRELVTTGLLHRIGEDEMIRPTRAALRC